MKHGDSHPRFAFDDVIVGDAVASGIDDESRAEAGGSRHQDHAFAVSGRQLLDRPHGKAGREIAVVLGPAGGRLDVAPMGPFADRSRRHTEDVEAEIEEEGVGLFLQDGGLEFLAALQLDQIFLGRRARPGNQQQCQSFMQHAARQQTPAQDRQHGKFPWVVIDPGSAPLTGPLQSVAAIDRPP